MGIDICHRLSSYRVMVVIAGKSVDRLHGSLKERFSLKPLRKASLCSRHLCLVLQGGVILHKASDIIEILKKGSIISSKWNSWHILFISDVLDRFRAKHLFFLDEQG